MHIADILDKDNIKIPLSSSKKNEIIQELLGIISDRDPSIDKEEAYSNLLEREKVGTTGIGSGVALPHARMENLKQVHFAFGISQDGSDFDSVDGKLVNLIFLILFPAQEVTTQVHLLARLSRLLNVKKLRKRLSECNTAQQVIEVFTRYEKAHFS
jgi:mannitol/fructose-specific phosphotransferase system IIA component (Ntr-type)